MRDYTEQHYLPAAQVATARARPRQRRGREQLVDLARGLDADWAPLRFGELTVTSAPGRSSTCRSSWADLDPEAVRVQLYADGIDGAGPQMHDMTRSAAADADRRQSPYRARVPAEPTRRPTSLRASYRSLAGCAVPLEAITFYGSARRHEAEHPDGARHQHGDRHCAEMTP